MHLYILQSEDGPVKIGITSNPHKRIGAIRTASGREFCRVYVSPDIGGADEIEARLFVQFAERRLPGEWFAIGFSEAMAAADRLGLQVAWCAWVDGERYVRGRAANVRMVEFMARGPTRAEALAFAEGFSGLESDADYAALCDATMVGAALAAVAPAEPVFVTAEVREAFVRKLADIRAELVALPNGSDSTI